MAAISDFLSDPNRRARWLVEAYPINKSTGLAVAQYWSTDQFATSGTDTPAHQLFTACVIEGINFELDVATPGTLGYVPSVRAGQIRLGQLRGDLDSLGEDYNWDGVRLVVKLGGYTPSTRHELSYDEYLPFELEVDSAKVGTDEVVITIREKGERFESRLQRRNFRSTGNTYDYKAVAYGDFGATPAKLNLRNNLVIEAWVWVNSFAAVNRFVTWTGATYPFWMQITTAGKLRFFDSAATVDITSTAALTVQRWFHIALILNGTTATWVIYNGGAGTEVIETATVSSSTRATSSGNFRISSASNAFGGMIDDLRIWNAARSTNQIRNFRHRELSALEASGSTLALYVMHNEPSGTSLADSSSSPLTGTITGAGAFYPSLTGSSGSGLEGQVLPDTFGKFEGFEPVLVDEALYIYQVHSANNQAFDAVREGGAAITLGTAYTNLRTFLAATTTAARYDPLTTADGTFFRLGSKPVLPITVDGQGDASGSGYVSTAGDIARRIATTRGASPLTDPGDLDTSSFTALNTANSAAVQFCTRERVAIGDALNFILGSVGAVHWFTRQGGLWHVERFEGVTGTSVLTLTSNEIISIQPSTVDIPIWRHVIRYRQNHRPLSQDEIASAVVGTTAQTYLMRPWRRLERWDENVRTNHPRSQTLETETGFSAIADASAEGERKLALFDGEPRAFDIECTLVSYELEFLDKITVTYTDLGSMNTEQERLGLTAIDFVLLGFQTVASESRTRLTVWREG